MWLSTRAAGFANLMVGYRGDRREYIFLPNQKCRFDSEDSIGIKSIEISGIALNLHISSPCSLTQFKKFGLKCIPNGRSVLANF